MSDSNNADVKSMRAKLVAFVESKGGQADRSDMKRHLGIDPEVWWPAFDQAVNTVKLQPVYGSGEISPGLFLSRKPVIAYRLADRQ